MNIVSSRLAIDKYVQIAVRIINNNRTYVSSCSVPLLLPTREHTLVTWNTSSVRVIDGGWRMARAYSVGCAFFLE